MRITFRQVEIFWAVMTGGSVTRAAALLHTSQPTVSRELARFQQVLGIALFQRQQGRLQPTAQALALFEEVQASYLGLERIGQLAEAIKTFRGGQLAVACLPVFSQSLLPLAAARFARQHPDVTLAVAAREPPLLDEWLAAQRYDLGLVERAQAPNGTRSELLLSADVVCVLPKDHPLAAKAVIAPRDLEGQAMVSLASADPYRMQLDAVLAREAVRTRAVIETEGAAAACQFVRQGLGIGILNPLTALSFAGPDVAVRRFGESIPFSVYLVTPEFRPASAVADAFARTIRTTCKDLNGQLRTLLGPVRTKKPHAK